MKRYLGAYVDGVKLIKSGKDEDFFKARANEFFNLSAPEDVVAGTKANRENFAEIMERFLFPGAEQNSTNWSLLGPAAERRQSERSVGEIISARGGLRKTHEHGNDDSLAS